MTHIKFVYFKLTGKYYSEGELDLPDLLFHEALEHVKIMLERGERPGLVDGFDFHTLVTVYTEHGPLPYLFARREDGTLLRNQR